MPDQVLGVPHAPLTSYAGYVGAVLSTPNLEVYYRFNDASGSTILDMLGLHNGTVMGGSVSYRNPGPMSDGYSTLFGNFGVYIAAYQLPASNERSFECWIKNSSLSTGRYPLWSDRGGTGGPAYYFGIGPGITSGGAAYNPHIELDGTNAAVGLGATGNPVNDGNWHHIVAMMGGPAGSRWQQYGLYAIYVDGALASSYSPDTYGDNGATVPFTPPTGGVIAAAMPVYLAEFAVYSRLLTAAEVLAHYQARS